MGLKAKLAKRSAKRKKEFQKIADRQTDLDNNYVTGKKKCCKNNNTKHKSAKSFTSSKIATTTLKPFTPKTRSLKNKTIELKKNDNKQTGALIITWHRKRQQISYKSIKQANKFNVAQTTNKNKSFLVKCEQLVDDRNCSEISDKFNNNNNDNNKDKDKSIKKKKSKFKPTSSSATSINYLNFSTITKLKKLNSSFLLRNNCTNSTLKWLSCVEQAKFFSLLALLSTLLVVIITNQYPIITAIGQLSSNLNESSQIFATEQASNDDSKAQQLHLQSQLEHYHQIQLLSSLASLRLANNQHQQQQQQEKEQHQQQKYIEPTSIVDLERDDVIGISPIQQEEDEIFDEAQEHLQVLQKQLTAQVNAENSQARKDSNAKQLQNTQANLLQSKAGGLSTKARGLLSLDSSNSLIMPQMQQIKSRFNQGCVGGTKCQFFAFCWMSGGSLGASCGLLMTCCVTPSKAEIQPVFYGPVINDPCK